jgi:hypothetical protein
MGSEFGCIRSTPTEMQSLSKNDFERFASTGVNTPPMAKMTDDGQLFRNRIKEGLGQTPREPSAACAATLAEYTPRETCPWRIVISPSHMACNIVTSLFFMLLISKVLLILARHRA